MHSPIPSIAHKPIAYTTQEGGYWQPFPSEAQHLTMEEAVEWGKPLGMKIILFSNGQRWDYFLNNEWAGKMSLEEVQNVITWLEEQYASQT